MKYDVDVVCFINEQYLKEVADEELGDTYEEVVEDGYDIILDSQSFHDYFYEVLLDGVSVTDDDKSYEREAGRMMEKDLDDALQIFYDGALQKEIQETPDYMMKEFNRLINSTLNTIPEIEDMKLITYSGDHMRLEVTSSLEASDLIRPIEYAVNMNTSLLLERMYNDYVKNLWLSYFERPLKVARKGLGFTSIALRQKGRGLYTKLEDIKRID